MTTSEQSQPGPVAADDGTRALTIGDPDDPALRHLAVVGDTYTILIAGADTAGRYALIDMLVPPGGGPPPHRHDFEEMFHILEGEIEVTIRETTSRASAGTTVNIPALVPHAFRNPTDDAIRLLCAVSPAGLEEYFAAFGDPLPSRTAPAPALSEQELGARMGTAAALAGQYRIEILS
jgi:quercetin dioxygenase-like cupin family protein